MMDYLARESAPISSELWEKIDAVVIDAARKHMVCRRFLSLHGPLGAGTSAVAVDGADKEESLRNGIGRTVGRRLVELPQLYQDFTLLWRDLAEAEKAGLAPDLSVVAAAAQKSARQEDNLILFGCEELGAEGLLNAAGTHQIKRGDWSTGEDSFRDVARGVAYLAGKSMLGRYALVLSPEIYLELQRLQPGVGLLEMDRIARLVDGRIYAAGRFGAGKAALLCAEPQYMDLAVGADLSVGYLEQRDLNHCFRILETAALRIKRPDAIVVFE